MTPTQAFPQFFGDYRVLRLLGEGGMGRVFLAEDQQLHRRVAVKMMLPEIALKADAKERFIREARAMAALKSEHIVTIYHIGEQDGIPYFVMELLDGMPLDKYLSSGQTLTWEQVIQIGIDLSKGLSAAHVKGLIHRDIKPGNIFLESPSGKVKILDFGLARPVEVENQVTKDGLIVGTLHYMSPEHASGKSVDGRSDLFSLGVILYELSTGMRPFEGKSAYEIMTQLAIHHPRPVVEVNPKAPPRLGMLIDRLLAKNPSDRPQTAEQVIHELQQVMNLEGTIPILALPSADFRTLTHIQPMKTTEPHHPQSVYATLPVLPESRSRWLRVYLGIACLIFVAIVWLITKPQRPDRSNEKYDPSGDYEITHKFPKDPPEPGMEMTNSINMKFVWIPPGEFDLVDETGKPIKHVTISKGFWMGQTEVTYKNWRDATGSYRDKSSTWNDYPIDNISWEGTREFLTTMRDKSGIPYRLPTECEWEYACRAGTKTPYYFGDSDKILPNHAWFRENWNKRYPNKVGLKSPNPWKLHDMYGNVGEWCQDWFGNQSKLEAIDPVQETEHPSGCRVVRGGSYVSQGKDCTSSSRLAVKQDFDLQGFRVCFSVE